MERERERDLGSLNLQVRRVQLVLQDKKLQLKYCDFGWPIYTATIFICIFPFFYRSVVTSFPTSFSLSQALRLQARRA